MDGRLCSVLAPAKTGAGSDDKSRIDTLIEPVSSRSMNIACQPMSR